MNTSLQIFEGGVSNHTNERYYQSTPHAIIKNLHHNHLLVLSLVQCRVDIDERERERELILTIFIDVTLGAS